MTSISWLMMLDRVWTSQRSSHVSLGSGSVRDSSRVSGPVNESAQVTREIRVTSVFRPPKLVPTSTLG
ncbi:hypothetical protein HanXRQr2_Chr10g0456121 [Helianthus annuus]|uniref:Uncharacterized protein n=1 Tax=Helianthus annuus TaxID=4232 RepID=A0A251TN79_HELAN|nr:hypothetical protein HanXRQr2_Chr10g0456121 [Helianthus annuus]